MSHLENQMPARILVVEDDPAVTALIAATLTHSGYSVEKSADAESAWKRLVSSSPDAVLLDWMLPGMSGFQLLRRLRADIRMRDLPVLMLTARVDEVDKIAALEAGVDDYVTKPFSPRELVARLKAVLRRRDRQAGEGIVESGDIGLSSASRKVKVRGIDVELGPVEFRLLYFLISHSERVYGRRQLITALWGECSSVEERTIDVHIRRLRFALEPHGCDSMVQTVRGSGYRFSTLIDGMQVVDGKGVSACNL
jgi:two-component system phosphate regulon response regulator PhoB